MTKDRTRASCIWKHGDLTTEPPGKSLRHPVLMSILLKSSREASKAFEQEGGAQTQPPPDVSSYPTLPSDFFLIQEPERSVISNDLSIPGLTSSSWLAPVVNSLPANAGVARDTDPIPGSGRPPGGGPGNPLQYSCLEDSMGRGTWRASVHWVAKSRTQLK